MVECPKPRSPHIAKIKKLAAKALKSPSMLTTEETRQLGGSVMAYLSPPQEKLVAAKRSASKKSSAKKA